MCRFMLLAGAEAGGCRHADDVILLWLLLFAFQTPLPNNVHLLLLIPNSLASLVAANSRDSLKFLSSFPPRDYHGY